MELAKKDHASVDFRAGQLLTTHEEEVEMCGSLISWTSCPAALISPDHPSLSLRRRCNMEVAFEGQTHGFCATNIAPMVLEGQ